MTTPLPEFRVHNRSRMDVKYALDLFCGAGGVACGLKRSGFYVIGVDIHDQPHYCGDEFHRADALVYPLDGYDLIWASPPCQRYTRMLNHGLTPRSNHPDLIGVMRDRIISSCSLYVIENVVGAPLCDPVMLCGEMFGLRVMRHRLFESNVTLDIPPHPPHRGRGIRSQLDGGYYYRVYGHETGKSDWGSAMGIDWMRSKELSQAIPPAYSEFIGKQLYPLA